MSDTPTDTHDEDFRPAVTDGKMLMVPSCRHEQTAPLYLKPRCGPALEKWLADGYMRWQICQRCNRVVMLLPNGPEALSVRMEKEARENAVFWNRAVQALHRKLDRMQTEVDRINTTPAFQGGNHAGEDRKQTH